MGLKKIAEYKFGPYKSPAKSNSNGTIKLTFFSITPTFLNISVAVFVSHAKRNKFSQESCNSFIARLKKRGTRWNVPETWQMLSSFEYFLKKNTRHKPAKPLFIQNLWNVSIVREFVTGTKSYFVVAKKKDDKKIHERF